MVAGIRSRPWPKNSVHFCSWRSDLDASSWGRRGELGQPGTAAKLSANARSPRARKSSETAETSHDGSVVGWFLMYFCYPYSACRRGTKEHFSGRLSGYFPRGTDLGDVTDCELEDIVREINNRPKKIFCSCSTLRNPPATALKTTKTLNVAVQTRTCVTLYPQPLR